MSDLDALVLEEYKLGPANIYALAEDDTFLVRARELGVDFGSFAQEGGAR